MSKRLGSEAGLESTAPTKQVKFDPSSHENWEPVTSFGAPPPHGSDTRFGHWNQQTTAGKGSTKVVEYNEKEQPFRGLAQHYRDHANKNPMVEVIIPPDAMVNSNKRVRSRMLWGDLVYTDDSDIVAVLMHMGYYAYGLAAPPPSVQEFHALLQLLPSKEYYPSHRRNSLTSRCWYAKFEGCSIKVDKFWMVTKAGGRVELDALTSGVPVPGPSFAPSHMERQMNTRAATAGRQRAAQDLTIQYNLCNEPWRRYNISVVADKGLKPSQWTSARLHSEALYLETRTERYELARVKPDDASDASDAPEVYRWSKCHKALPLSIMQKVGVPLPAAQISVLHKDLVWEDLKWGFNAMSVKGVEYKMVRIHFMKSTPPSTSAKPQASAPSDKS